MRFRLRISFSSSFIHSFFFFFVSGVFSFFLCCFFHAIFSSINKNLLGNEIFVYASWKSKHDRKSDDTEKKNKFSSIVEDPLRKELPLGKIKHLEDLEDYTKLHVKKSWEFFKTKFSFSQVFQSFQGGINFKFNS